MIETHYNNTDGTITGVIVMLCSWIAVLSIYAVQSFSCLIQTHIPPIVLEVAQLLAYLSTMVGLMITLYKYFKHKKEAKNAVDRK